MRGLRFAVAACLTRSALAGHEVAEEEPAPGFASDAPVQRSSKETEEEPRAEKEKSWEVPRLWFLPTNSPVLVMGWLYVAVFFLGKTLNSRKATRVLDPLDPLFKENFDVCGPVEQTEYAVFERKCIPYQKGVSCATARVNLCRRHDLIYQVSSFLFPEKDAFRLEFWMPRLEPFCTVFWRKGSPSPRGFAALRDCKVRKGQNCDLHLTMSDTAEVVPFFEAQIRRIFQEAGGALERVHISGRYAREGTGDKPQGCVAVDFAVDEKTAESVSAVLVLLLQLTESADCYQLPEKARKAVERSLVVKDEVGTCEPASKQHEEWQRAARERKVQKEKERVAKMTPEELRKWEEKQNKKDLRSRMTGKGKKVVMKS